jgi:hypothetical protein
MTRCYTTCWDLTCSDLSGQRLSVAYSRAPGNRSPGRIAWRTWCLYCRLTDMPRTLRSRQPWTTRRPDDA